MAFLVTPECIKLSKKVYSRETRQKVFQICLSNKNSTRQLVLSLLTVVLTCYWWLLLSCLLGHFLKYVMWKLCHPEIRLYKVSPGIVADYKQMRLCLVRLLQRHQNSLPQMQKIQRKLLKQVQHFKLESLFP